MESPPCLKKIIDTSECQASEKTIRCIQCSEILIFTSDTKITASNKFAIKTDNGYICSGCNDIMDLFDGLNKKDSSTVIKKENLSKKCVSQYQCMKCKNIYNGNFCNKCNTPNPLMRRKKKKK